ncbi:NADH dehydrogenase [ubiquinone] 1 alpha subcomplex assembly factor 2 [Vespa crabro]|uniref:NADH dehydrogenase [ubiquinone] 1 alpha subcomplex assembly factor 2 n=1 Tax=Vespa crabro TaxID=7445 RepID=UPI001F011F6E|nr:NADH dehydrogenase [ubiquinone] 1 alpha subcomplex assembly factor 2 [Vespa crabro]
MSGRQRGLFRMIFRDFLASIRPNISRPKLMGEDYFGTKYYEVPISSTSTKKKPARYFKAINNDFEQEIPAEWEAWLRYRRKEPPTFIEIETNYKMQIIKKMNAAKLEASNKELTTSKKTDIPVEKRGYESFPVYDEYNSTSKYIELKPKLKLK